MAQNRLTRGTALVGDVKADKGSVPKVLVGSIARTDTVAKTLGKLPANAVITDVAIYSPTASDAATTATLSLAKVGGNGHDYLNAYDVKTAGTGAGQNHPNGAALGSVGASSVSVTGIYAETGTASTTGGPWQVAITYKTV